MEDELLKKRHIICFIILILLSISYIVYAEEVTDTAAAQKYHAFLKIYSDGTVDMVETITYDTEINKEIEMKIDASRASFIENITVKIYDAASDGYINYTKTDKEKPGKNEYGLKEYEENKQVFNLTAGTYDLSITVRYAYSLKDAVYIYNDGAVFSAALIPIEHKDTVEEAVVIIDYPTGTRVTDAKAYIEGKYITEQGFNKTGEYVIKTIRIKPDEYCIINILLEPELISEGRIKILNDLRQRFIDNMESAESVVAVKALQEAEERKKTILIGIGLLAVALSAAIWLFVRIASSRKRRKRKHKKHK